MGGDTVIVPCYYLFALMSPDNRLMQTMILMDGDFINYDFELHKEAKYSNVTEYNHGPYGEGSVRHRKMYTYPNPLNSQIEVFHARQLLVIKKNALEGRPEARKIQSQIVRTDRYGNDFYYALIDETQKKATGKELTTLTGIFDACKQRQPKERVASGHHHTTAKPRPAVGLRQLCTHRDPRAFRPSRGGGASAFQPHSF